MRARNCQLAVATHIGGPDNEIPEQMTDPANSLPKGAHRVRHEHGRLNAFEVFLWAKARMERGESGSIIRLGDGEGAFLGYPTITNRRVVDEYLLRWLRTKSIDEADVLYLVDALKSAVRSADIVGLPRGKQLAHRIYRVVPEAIEAFELMNNAALSTHAALHRLLQHALLFRPLLQNTAFLGLISCRRIADELQRIFNIDETCWYGVKGEDVTHFTEATEDTPGDVETVHYPDGYYELRDTLQVPFPGALFLVGAGAFGKIYCQWIKELGGVAIDIGSLFDSWAGVGRVGLGPGIHIRSLAVYDEYPRITRQAAVKRYNSLVEQFSLDVPQATTSTGYYARLPEFW